MAGKPRAEYEIRAKDNSDAGWRSALSTADRNVKRLKSALGSGFAGIIGVSTFTSQIAKAIEFGDEIGKLKVKIGATAGATQELVAVARQFDIELDSLATSMKKMQIAISQAATGNKELVTTFAALGLDIDRIRRLKPDEQFEAIGDAISRLREEEERARAENTIFGRSGSNLRPMFENGAAGIRKARMEVREFGQVLSDMDIKKLQEADDAIKKLSASWNAFWRNLAVGTVRVGQALDVIDKDVIGEMKDQLTLANKELRDATLLPEGGAFDPERYKRAAEAVQILQRQIANLEATYSRGGGKGRPQRPAAPGFGKASKKPTTDGEKLKAITDLLGKTDWTDEMRASVAEAERFFTTIDEADRSTNKWLESTMDLTDELQDLPEPFIELSDSLIQADELQKEFTRDMFVNVRDLFLAAGKGADDFADALLNSFERVLADRATLELFDMLGDLGGSLTEKSGGKGFLGLVGAGLTSLFGGATKLAGGMDYVPRDNFPALLHKGERVVPAHLNSSAGARMVFAPVYNIDARGATPDAIRLLPEIMKRNNDALEARIVQRLRSGRYG